jgi:LmbE family N-acetylglucosaminyl deacetylase
MPLVRPLPRRLVGIWAHPDDEAYLSAGLMARVVDAGGQVTVVTATRGEKGTDDPALYDSDDFGAHRERELRASLAELGVTDVRFLGLRDGECDFAADADVVDRLTEIIAEVEPDCVVTFGPDGMTNHLDHRAVSRWTTEAVRRLPVQELLYAAVTHDFLRRHDQLHDELGVFAEFPTGRPPAIARDLIALECTLTPAELARKRRALAAHESQTAPLAAAMGEDRYVTWWASEWYRRPTWAEMRSCAVPAWMHEARSAPELAAVS